MCSFWSEKLVANWEFVVTFSLNRFGGSTFWGFDVKRLCRYAPLQVGRHCGQSRPGRHLSGRVGSFRNPRKGAGLYLQRLEKSRVTKRFDQSSYVYLRTLVVSLVNSGRFVMGHDSGGVAFILLKQNKINDTVE